MSLENILDERGHLMYPRIGDLSSYPWGQGRSQLVSNLRHNSIAFLLEIEMARFRRTSSRPIVPESPVLLFRDLDRDPNVKFLWGHQEKLLDEYASTHLKAKNLAIELPTGSGKTLVGLLIAEYYRRVHRKPTSYLCPTRQLATQVKTQSDRYGIASSLLIGKQKDYNERDFMQYQSADATAITTYSGVFNSNPRIDEPSLIICDDAHAAANYVASMWTVSITQKLYPDTFLALFNVLRPVLTSTQADAVEASIDGRSFPRTTDMISGIRTHRLTREVTTALDQSLPDKSPADYAWRNIREHIEACSIYCSGHTIEIRPVFPPTATHRPFDVAQQRVYMSATLGEDGDIERCFGVEAITRLAIPKGWDKRGTGRRLILFPGLVEDDEENGWDTTKQILADTPRSLVLVPSDRDRDRVLNDLEESGFNVLGAEDVEDSLEPFTSSERSVLLIANRYEGIDLPGDTCRVLVLLGLPTGGSLQEQYLIERLSAVSQLRDRIRTRVTQAIGRCTRDESDYSVILVLGDDALKWCCTTANIQGMHPEIQAEIEFGIDNSKDRSTDDIVELCEAFLAQDKDWKSAERDIRDIRDKKKKVSDEHSKTLSQTAADEIRFQYRMWNGDYEDALTIGQSVVENLAGGSALRPYQSFWLHNVAVAAFLWSETSGISKFRTIAAKHIRSASATSTGIRWLPEVRAELLHKDTVTVEPVLPIQEWYMTLMELLAEWKLVGGRFSREMADLVKLVQSKKSKPFERGLATLGRVLGACTHTWDEEGAPDGLWVFGEWHAFVFEAKTDGTSDKLALKYIRQAKTHEERVRKDNLITKTTPCGTVIVSPYTKLDRIAAKHSAGLYHINQDELVRLLSRAHTALTNLRSRSVEGFEETFDDAKVVYEVEECFVKDIKALLTSEKVLDLPHS